MATSIGHNSHHQANTIQNLKMLVRNSAKIVNWCGIPFTFMLIFINSLKMCYLLYDISRFCCRGLWVHLKYKIFTLSKNKIMSNLSRVTTCLISRCERSWNYSSCILVKQVESWVVYSASCYFMRCIKFSIKCRHLVNEHHTFSVVLWQLSSALICVQLA